MVLPYGFRHSDDTCVFVGGHTVRLYLLAATPSDLGDQICQFAAYRPCVPLANAIWNYWTGSHIVDKTSTLGNREFLWNVHLRH